jgi:hypothetical protein
MRRTLVLCAALATMLGGAAVAIAAGGDDDYGYGPATTTNTTTTTTGAASEQTTAKTKTYSYRATLAAKAEVPKPKAPAAAGGSFSATVTEIGKKSSVKWTLTFHGLSGKALAAHIHLAKPGAAGPVIVPLCGPCRSGMTGRGTMTHDQGEMLERGLGYVNVHTAKNKGGEIRGQLKLTSHA